MKATYIRLVLVALCLCFGVRFADAQGCRLDYTPNYSIYESESTDGTNIYTSVLVEGSTTGSGSAGCNGNNATHTPKAYNMLGTTGGWVSGTPGHMNSYSTVQNNQDVPGGPGIIYLNASGEIDCSMFGTFWSGGFAAEGLRFANAVWTDGTPALQGTGCVYHKTACTFGKATCTGGGGVQPTGGCYDYAHQVNLVVNGTCIYPGIIVPTSGPGPCN